MATTLMSYDGPSKFAPLRNIPFQLKLYKFRSGVKGNVLVNLKKRKVFRFKRKRGQQNVQKRTYEVVCGVNVNGAPR